MSFTPGQGQPTEPAPPPQSEQPVPEWAMPAQPGQSAPPVWARQVQQIEWRPTEPLEYHQLYRGAARYRWWKPLLALVLGVIFYFTLSAFFIVPVLIIYFAAQGGDPDVLDALMLAALDTQNPLTVFVALGSIALMIPAVWLAMLSTGLTPKGRGWSVALRIRWRWIWRTALMSVVVLIVMNVIGIGIDLAFTGLSGAGAEEPPEITIDPMLALWSMLIVLLLVPLQATAEELVYRGMFMQTLGAWFGGARGQSGFAKFVRGPWIPIMLPAILFGFSHIYDIWGFLAVTVMAVAAGWLAWRTGGLEAAISLHVINNLVAFGFMAVGAGGETAQTSDGGGPAGLIGQVIGLVLYCWWVDRDFQRRDGRRTRIDYVQVKV